MKDEDLMFDVNEMLSPDGPGTKLSYIVMEDLKVEKTTKLQFTRGDGHDYGYVITKTFIARVAVVDDEDNKHLKMKKLNFLPED